MVRVRMYACWEEGRVNGVWAFKISRDITSSRIFALAPSVTAPLLLLHSSSIGQASSGMLEAFLNVPLPKEQPDSCKAGLALACHFADRSTQRGAGQALTSPGQTSPPGGSRRGGSSSSSSSCSRSCSQQTNKDNSGGAGIGEAHQYNSSSNSKWRRQVSRAMARVAAAPRALKTSKPAAVAGALVFHLKTRCLSKQAGAAAQGSRGQLWQGTISTCSCAARASPGASKESESRSRWALPWAEEGWSVGGQLRLGLGLSP